MAALSFARKSLVVLLACTAMVTALDPNAGARLRSDEGVQRFLHHLARRHAQPPEPSEHTRSGPMGALLETGKLLSTAAMLPAETLQVVRMVTVPLINTTLALPANLLEGAASMGSKFDFHGHARSTSSDLWKYLKPWKLIPTHHVLLSKDIALGPLSLKKVLEFGAPKDKLTTPAPAVVLSATTPLPEPAPAPAAVPVTEAPPPPALPLTTPPPVAVTPAAPNPLVVVVPQGPNESTNQIAVVQNSRAGPVASAAGISEDSN